jgi:ABC-type multidrug transport system fused ATPase/permease subunit
MLYSKAFGGYLVSLCFLPISVFVFFYKRFCILSEFEYIPFYISISAVFFFIIFLILCWYFSFLFVKSKTLIYINQSIQNILNIDPNKISTEDLKSFRHLFISNTREKEIGSIVFYSCTIPSLLCLLTTVGLITIVNYKSIYTLLTSIIVLFILLHFAYTVINLCDIRKYNNWFDLFQKISISSYKGVQFYNSETAIKEKFLKCQNIIKKEIRSNLSKTFFRVFLRSCLLFCSICILYILKEDYVTKNFFDLAGIADLFFFTLFLFIICFCSFARYLSTKNISIDIIENAQIESEPEDLKSLSGNNLFIAFHNVCFQNPTIVSDELLLNDLSFSTLPGEFVAITGESATPATQYIFELLLKYYNIQSGTIYLSGTKLESISKSSVRKLIAIFRADFGLIIGNVFENLELASPIKDSRKLEYIADKFGLFESLNLSVYSDNGEFAISQETRIRIQLARIYMQKPKIVLIEAPEFFEDYSAKEVFTNFVKNISKKKTIFILTYDIKTLVYANKILYLGKRESYFGTPVELSRIEEYGNYFRKLQEN